MRRAYLLRSVGIGLAFAGLAAFGIALRPGASPVRADEPAATPESATAVKAGAAEAGASAPALQLKKHERVALVGNALAQRMSLFGHFETLLHSRMPEQEIVFRNFGWPADEVGNQQRPNSYTTIDDPLEVYGPETFLCFFGFNESFAGEAGVPLFKQRYAAYLDNLSGRFNRAGDQAQFVLVSPIAFEATGNRLQPTGEQENANLALYTQAIAEFAAERGLPFVDLFNPTLSLFAEEPGAQFTIDGCHLNEAGDLLVGQLLDASLFPEENPAQIGSESYEKLRAAVNEKSWVHNNDYRMLNGWYVYGGRRTYDTETFPLEYKKIRAMAAVRDRYTWDIAQGKSVPEVPDDSETGELIVPPSGVGRHYPRAEPKELYYPTPEEAIAMMTVPKGMKVTCFASELDFPELAKPCQIEFDSKGRLWAACMPNYPQWRPGDPRPDDRLLIFEDTDKDGKADDVKVFYDKLICPTGFEFWNGGVLVVDEPHILFLKDTDGDDKADEVTHVIDGFATDDTHHTVGAWEWSHGGQLYMLEGVSLSTTIETPWGPFRNRNTAGVYVWDPVSLKIRRFQTPGYGNPWCMVFDEWGQEIVGDGTNANQHWGSPLSGADPVTRATTQPIFDNGQMRPAVGSDFLTSRHLPDDMQGQFIYACVINMNGMPRFTVVDDPDSAGLTGKRIENLLSSTDKVFRPVDPKIGPDGAIWFGDWCNALIGHMQYSQRDPNRDTTRGRIYRLTNENKPLLDLPTQAGKSIPELLDQLREYEPRTRYRARRELRDRDMAEVLSAVDAWVAKLDPQAEDYQRAMCEALWIQESFRQVDPGLLGRILKSPDFHARTAATHVMANEWERIDGSLALLEQSLRDEHPRVRLEALRGISFFKTPEAARLALSIVSMPMDYWLEYTLHHTLLAMRPFWEPSHVKGEFLTGATETETKRFADFLEKLGPSVKAIPFLQTLANPDAPSESREKALQSLVGMEGNAREGSFVYQRVCSVCHTMGTQGVNFGPALDKIDAKKRGAELRRFVLHSIVEPNAEIQEQYRTVKIITSDGRVVTGFIEKETDDVLTVREAGGKIRELPKDDIEERILDTVSSMPEGLGFSISPAELIDLTAYVEAQNK
ncbi:MAG TPA: PVC-type heme-binding CxxCH protein [Pirellulaceae bacterium]|jgi:putative heme-binding domain-containing protein|nr:PVC-type heme-binding CxxCH protein [Pirellulaceae bacterium]